jgi:N-acylglucosamine-6-phosphate 2-epimerase
MMNSDLEKLRGKLIVSCQAPVGSPLDDPYIISALALTAEQNGAAGVRINTPDHIAATKARVSVPIIGIEKVVTDGSDVYITPTFDAARRVSMSGASIIAIDGTWRPRPAGESLDHLIRRIQTELRKPLMADISTYDEGLYVADRGAEIIATTLCGHTAESKGATLPALDLLERLAARLSQPVICEGSVVSPDQVHRAFDCGAFAVVVGAAITSVGSLTRQFAAASGPQWLSPSGGRK